VKPDHVPSSPHFFRPVVRSLVALVVLLAVAAAFLPAPLGVRADPAHAPNPAKSAWFLLWIQELVSHGTVWMYAVLALAVAFTVLPWLRPRPATRAAWFAPGERLFGVLTVGLLLAVLALTIVAYFFRGEQWRLSWPG
jgi:hypothetical protein